MDKIRILQLGNEDWSKSYRLPQRIIFEYSPALLDAPQKPYDIVFLDKTPSKGELEPLQEAVTAYTLFVTPKVDICGKMQELYDCKMGRRIEEADIQRFLLQEVRYFFPKPYGEKFDHENIAIAQGFPGFVKWRGNYGVILRGSFGKELQQALYWRNNIPVAKGQVLDLWLEYRKNPEIEISLIITKFAAGSISEILQRWEFGEKELDKIVRIDGGRADGWIFISLHAKGEGELQVIALHDRYSRGDHGYFLPGGERYVTSEREEIFCYFDPGDRKPPLNIYFSGYKTKQGFEGYRMMKGMRTPFLLVSEPRLQGGSFYMGSKEYERLMVEIIKKHIEELGFGPDQVIMAGLSMGTYGALYYGCDIEPHAILLGKPLISIGNVAANEKYLRPGGFPTSLDVLLYLCGGTEGEAVERLNRRFWDKFDASDWSRTKFIISYMIEDDYDPDAYKMLISHLRSGGVQVYGKGLHGRHNDNTGGIVAWFTSQYEKVLREDFGRRT